jgi:CRISPR associated protein
MLACPSTGDVQDLYLMHQAVWSITERQKDVEHPPTLIYRHDNGIIRVRISDCAMKGTKPVDVSLAVGTQLSVRVKLALWRTVPQEVRHGQIENRVRQLLHGAGLTCLKFRSSQYVARGYKSRLNAEIALPIADVSGTARIENADLTANAWTQGVGRGKRFGFGMLDLSPVSVT